jgi:hypothetical protein
MANKQKTFVRGSAREKIFDNGGRILNVSLNVDDITAYANDKGYAPLVVAERAEADDYGNTHYIYIDDYSIQKQKERMQGVSEEEAEAKGSHRKNPFK